MGAKVTFKIVNSKNFTPENGDGTKPPFVEGQLIFVRD